MPLYTETGSVRLKEVPIHDITKIYLILGYNPTRNPIFSRPSSPMTVPSEYRRPIWATCLFLLRLSIMAKEPSRSGISEPPK